MTSTIKKTSSTAIPLEKFAELISIQFLNLLTQESTHLSTTAFKNFCKSAIYLSRAQASTIAIGLVYFERLQRAQCHSNTLMDFGMLCLNVITCLMIANKVSFDCPLSLRSWSMLSGIPKNCLFRFEMEVLRVVEYTLSINDAEYHCKLERLMAIKTC